MSSADWVIAPTDEALSRTLSEGLGISPVTARILAGRGIGSVDEARTFLSPKLDQMIEPDSLADIDKASERLLKAIEGGERILVYGDYDADGICAAALMKRFIDLLGGDATVHIPNRLEEAYGLRPESVEAIAETGATLVVTVDCGVTAVEEAKLLAARGIDLVITDHHQPSHELPDACAVVDPNRHDCEYPFKELSGTGVAYKVVWATAVRQAGARRLPERSRRFLLDALGLAALGTVADVVELRGENRVLVRFGLESLFRTSMPGLKALIKTSGLDGKLLGATDIAFKLAPRLNAAGRIGDPYRALDLLLTSDEDEAARMASELDRANRERQSIQARVLDNARSRAQEAFEGGDLPAIVLASDSWHLGVVGIAAGQLAREFHRPCVLVAMNGDSGRGSARSIKGFELHTALEECSDTLLRHGGHAMAAGVTVEASRFEEFRTKFLEVAADRLSAGGGLRPSIQIDAICPLSAISESLCGELDSLRPFGQGNPAPVVATGAVKLVGQVRVMGSGGRHVSFFASDGKSSFRAVGFGMGSRVRELDALTGSRIEIAHRPKISDFRGTRSVELFLEDVRPDDA